MSVMNPTRLERNRLQANAKHWKEVIEWLSCKSLTELEVLEIQAELQRTQSRQGKLWNIPNELQS